MSEDRPGLSESLQLITLLASDLGELAKIKGKVDEQFLRRLAVRNFFPTLEAFLHYLKAQALEAHRFGRVRLSDALLAELAKRAPHATENLKAAFRAYACARGVDTPLGGELPLPDEFQVCLAVRNRLTHPKRLKDMAITDQEVAALTATAQWFVRVSAWAAGKQTEYHATIRKEINASFDAFPQKTGHKPGGET